jgi:hypothetical protein
MPIADCRLKKWCGSFLPCQSVPPRRDQSAIPDILGQTMIAVILRKARTISEMVLPRGLPDVRWENPNGPPFENTVYARALKARVKRDL